MEHLKYINLSGNRIRRLPPQVANFGGSMFWRKTPPWPTDPSVPEAGGLDLRGNPLEEPPIEVVAKGRDSVARYFQFLGGDRKSVNEAKLLLVGDGGAGKTSLMKQLLERQFDPKEKPDSRD
jgi:internalin A